MICPFCEAEPPKREKLPSYVTPIRQFPDDGRTTWHKGDCPEVDLTPEAKAELRARLRLNAEARARALVSSRFYVVFGRRDA